MTTEFQTLKEIVAETLELQKAYLEENPGAQSALDQFGAAAFEDLLKGFNVDLRHEETARIATSVAMYMFNTARISAGIEPGRIIYAHNLIRLHTALGKVANGIATQVVSLHRDLVEGAA